MVSYSIANLQNWCRRQPKQWMGIEGTAIEPCDQSRGGADSICDPGWLRSSATGQKRISGPPKVVVGYSGNAPTCLDFRSIQVLPKDVG